jgi:Holliday junction resolvasome RuvABC endonuclease subunit
MKVLALDQALASTGWVVYDKSAHTPVKWGTIKTKRLNHFNTNKRSHANANNIDEDYSTALIVRIKALTQQLDFIVESHNIKEVYMEQVYCSPLYFQTSTLVSCCIFCLA